MAQSTDDQLKLQQMGREMFIAEMRPWMKNAFETQVPFLERYDWFWSNHFTISVLKARMVFFAGSYEREAIRPMVLGKFEDLLISTVRHPAMLIYLDNAFSIGPNSPAGKFVGTRPQRKPRPRDSGAAHARRRTAATRSTTSSNSRRS